MWVRIQRAQWGLPGVRTMLWVLDTDYHVEEGFFLSSEEVRIVSVLNRSLNVECRFKIWIWMPDFGPLSGFNFILPW